MNEGSITIRLPAKIEEIERLNRLVRQFGELHEIPSRTLYAVNLAIDELVTNAILHGYSDPAGQEIVVRLDARPRELAASLIDSGREFNPLEAPLPDLSVPLEKRELGGLGIHLVRSLMDHVDWQRTDGQNVLTVHKRMR
jgi:serine/threonine-protein kinase RsbW